MIDSVEVAHKESPEAALDFRNPNYLPIIQARAKRLAYLRDNPDVLPSLKVHYREHIAQFITDFGVTVDPRNVERGLPTTIPFILFPKQVKWVEWIIAQWRGQKTGITEKTRQMGFSWLSMSVACSLCIFYKGMAIGVGSRKQEYVDVLGDPKSLMQKARLFMMGLPVEFRAGWDIKNHAPHMRMMFPAMESHIVGECGDNIGRGNSTSIYFVDEAAFIERPQLVDAALSQTTNCRQDISTPNGMANPFAEKRFKMAKTSPEDVFSFHWRDDPRKDEAWYEKQKRTLDPVTLAQEVDMSYTASTEGVLIPSEWIQAAIGAHLKLGISPSGIRRGALDVADEGRDTNAFAGRHGCVLQVCQQWSGKGSDIYESVVKTFALCESFNYTDFHYDADGLGAGVRGDARAINTVREAIGKSRINDEPFRGSAAVYDPESEMVPKRKNKDLFANAKAQSWWALRMRFQTTHRAVVDGMMVDPDDIISINPDIEDLIALTRELSQPTYSYNNAGKTVINKMPEGMKSPNMGDAVMICFHPGAKKKAWTMGKL